MERFAINGVSSHNRRLSFVAKTFIFVLQSLGKMFFEPPFLNFFAAGPRMSTGKI